MVDNKQSIYILPKIKNFKRSITLNIYLFLVKFYTSKNNHPG